VWTPADQRDGAAGGHEEYLLQGIGGPVVCIRGQITFNEGDGSRKDHAITGENSLHVLLEWEPFAARHGYRSSVGSG